MSIVDAAKPVALGITPGKPQNTRKNPVVFMKSCAKFLGVDLTTRTAHNKDRIFRLICTDPGADKMLPAQRAVTAALSPCASTGCPVSSSKNNVCCAIEI